jgi:triacylglycerol lipase
MGTWRAWRGVKSLVHDAVSATTTLVGEGNDSAARAGVRVAGLVPGLRKPVRVIDGARKLGTDGVLLSVKGMNRLVESLSNLVLDVAEPLEPEAPPIAMRSDIQGTRAWAADALIGAVNGVVGDHLAREGNPLDMGLTLRWAAGSRPATRPSRVAVFVHGMAATEWCWAMDSGRLLGDPAATFGTLLERDLGHLPVFVRYNSGRHISESGLALAEALHALWAEMALLPRPDGEEAAANVELVLVGHSAGGLVARSATLVAASRGLNWLGSLSRVVCLGTPHQGAVLERFGHAAAAALHAIDLPATRIPAALIRARSAGIKDLRHGDVREEAWRGREPDARAAAEDVVAADLVPGVRYAFMAGSVLPDPNHRMSDLIGDLLVQVRSAEGPRDVTLKPTHAARFGAIHHNEMQVHPEVYAQLRRFCAGELDGAPGIASLE